MKVSDFNLASELPIGGTCYIIKSFLPTPFKEVREYCDSHSFVYNEEKVKKYMDIVNSNRNSSLEYESTKLIGVKDDYFLVEDVYDIIHVSFEIFLSQDDLKAYWEQYLISWKEEKDETIRYIKDTYPEVSKAAQEIEAKNLEGAWNLTDEQKQRIIEQY